MKPLFLLRCAEPPRPSDREEVQVPADGQGPHDADGLGGGRGAGRRGEDRAPVRQVRSDSKGQFNYDVRLKGWVKNTSILWF